MKRNLSIIIFWGAAWGIAEATLGYFLHLIPINIGWIFWYPLAFYFMRKAYIQTNKLSSVMFTSFIAAAIKLVNLLMPVRIDFVINPAAAIILEGIAVFCVFRIMENKGEELKESLSYLHALGLNFSWRALYVIYVLFLPAYLIEISPISGLAPFLKFFFLESLVNSLFIFAYLKLVTNKINQENAFNINPSPVVSLVVLALAVTVQCLK